MNKTPPSARFELLKDIEHELYRRTHLRLYEELTTIIIANSKLCGNTLNELSFRGKFYYYGTKVQVKGLTNPLHKTLRPAIRQYEENRTALEREKSLVRGYFQNVVMQSDRISDYYLLTPEALHGALRNVAKYFSQDEPLISVVAAQGFRKENEKYIALIRDRMTYNLLGVSEF